MNDNCGRCLSEPCECGDWIRDRSWTRGPMPEAVPLVASPAPVEDLMTPIRERLQKHTQGDVLAWSPEYSKWRMLKDIQTALAEIDRLAARPVSLVAPPQELIDRATEWLTKGGFFNAEVMAACHPNETSQLVIDMRDALKAAPPALVAPAQESSHSVGTGASVTITHTAAPPALAPQEPSVLTDLQSVVSELDRVHGVAATVLRDLRNSSALAAPHPREDEHPYALGTLARALHDIETRDLVITSLEAEIARLRLAALDHPEAP